MLCSGTPLRCCCSSAAVVNNPTVGKSYNNTFSLACQINSAYCLSALTNPKDSMAFIIVGSWET
jgi:hypothetical protein